MSSVRAVPTALAGAFIAMLVGCSAGAGPAPPGKQAAAPVSSPGGVTAAAPAATPTAGRASAPAPPPAPVAEEPVPEKTAAATAPASLSIPSIGVDELRVVPYEGTTDDRPGTRIQNRGVAASPYGDGGGVGPGQVGNYLVTAHRLSAGGPLRDLPSVGVGDRVLVSAGGTVYEYRITGTRKTSFRSQRSLAEQRSAVPGFPGRQPTKAMITISTCATPEDTAAGNLWRDDRGNPEHRIDKVGVLASVREHGGGPGTG
ncbi:class E sortase [Streptomyces sp. NPDC057445]|uniref:class E sortase n=1 Tax=Streptomyces sp. NPDC057445 TaxID=3346136 RepID=UPI0036918DD4